jgi:hypothetical protein
VDPVYEAVRGTSSRGPGSPVKQGKPDKAFQARLKEMESVASQWKKSSQAE